MFAIRMKTCFEHKLYLWHNKVGFLNPCCLSPFTSSCRVLSGYDQQFRLNKELLALYLTPMPDYKSVSIMRQSQVLDRHGKWIGIFGGMHRGCMIHLSLG